MTGTAGARPFTEINRYRQRGSNGALSLNYLPIRRPIRVKAGLAFSCFYRSLRAVTDGTVTGLETLVWTRTAEADSYPSIGSLRKVAAAVNFSSAYRTAGATVLGQHKPDIRAARTGLAPPRRRRVGSPSVADSGRASDPPLGARTPRWVRFVRALYSSGGSRARGQQGEMLPHWLLNRLRGPSGIAWRTGVPVIWLAFQHSWQF